MKEVKCSRLIKMKGYEDFLRIENKAQSKLSQGQEY